jgi:hypothetical protein
MSFDLDLEVRHHSPLSIDRPLTTNASSVEVSILDFLLTSSDNKAPTTESNSRVYVDINPIEVTKLS